MFKELRPFEKNPDPNHIYTTVGVYNGDINEHTQLKVNGVTQEWIEHHIDYNKTYRFGRALFVDGQCVYTGYLSETAAYQWEHKITHDLKLKRTKDTSPYH